LIPVLQVAVAPVILISGVGLLLLSLTNRFGRAVDRARQLRREIHEASASDRRQLADQVSNLYRRAQLIQAAIILAVSSVLSAALLVVSLFVEAILRWQSAALVTFLFVFCMVSLIGSLIAFILDIRLSLAALKLDLERQD
jgi:Protein of unknown function (DUF2721)